MTSRRIFRLTVSSPAATLNERGTRTKFLTRSQEAKSTRAFSMRSASNWPHARFVGQGFRLVRSQFEPLLPVLEERLHLAPVRHDQGRQKMPAIAVDHGLIDAGIAEQQPLDLRWRNLFAVGQHQKVLLSAGDVQEAVVIEPAQVAGVQPAVADGLGGRRAGSSSSPSSHGGRDVSISPSAAIFDLHARQRRPDRSQLVADPCC